MNNYQVLGLKGSETKDEIKSKFRSLSKQLHPDVNGGDASKTKKFIEVLKAYNELMEGVTGESTQKDTYNSYNDYYQKKSGKYRFIGITKDAYGNYLISFFMSGIKKVSIYGLNGNHVARYDLDGGARDYNLKLSPEDAKLAKYQFKITLYDGLFNRATVTYKVKKPKNTFSKILDYVIRKLPKRLSSRYSKFKQRMWFMLFKILCRIKKREI